jgi:CopA family copper-resistance protein
VDELQIAAAETYDVIVEPKEDVYTIFAESMDRSGYARGTLAIREGMSAPIPELRPRPLLSMVDMGMAHNNEEMSHGKHGMDHDDGNMSEMRGGDAGSAHDSHGEIQHGSKHSSGPRLSHGSPAMHGPDHHGPANAMVAMMPKSRLHEPGTGLENVGHRVLAYTDLRNLKPGYDPREPSREVEMHITGNMERYMWSIDGKKFSEAEPILFRYGERLRITLVNDTMMNHPFHLHGMWMELENGAGAHKPRKHTINVKPGEKLSFDVTADAEGDWAFHCHLLFHMHLGMFRTVTVTKDQMESHHERG